MYDLNRVKSAFDTACLKAGVVADTNNIFINSRLTHTHGRVFHEWDAKIMGYVPTKVEFSKQMLDHATDESIRQVILHEAAHYIAMKKTHENHGHDSYFKSVCASIGCTLDKSSGELDYNIPTASLYKYRLMCPKCGVIGGYNRKCKTVTTNAAGCICKKCKSKLWIAS